MEIVEKRSENVCCGACPAPGISDKGLNPDATGEAEEKGTNVDTTSEEVGGG
jgi:hypothetical protein